jgi:predicted DNA-binding transcriptional regulator AlpA
MPDTKILVKDREAAEMLSIGRSTFWREVGRGNLPPPVKIGGLTRWRVSDLQAAAHRASQTTKP